MAQFSFNAAEVNPQSDFDPVPNGEYPVIVIESEWKETKAGTGTYLQLVLEVIDGAYKGRKIWDRLNLKNQNQTAVNIAQKALSQICHSIGHLNLEDTVELHNKPMLAKIVVKQQPGYNDSNEVKEYKPMAGGASTAAQVPQQQQPAAQPAQAGGGAPWN